MLPYLAVGDAPLPLPPAGDDAPDVLPLPLATAPPPPPPPIVNELHLAPSCSRHTINWASDKLERFSFYLACIQTSNPTLSSVAVLTSSSSIGSVFTFCMTLIIILSVSLPCSHSLPLHHCHSRPPHRSNSGRPCQASGADSASRCHLCKPIFPFRSFFSVDRLLANLCARDVLARLAASCCCSRRRASDSSSSDSN